MHVDIVYVCRVSRMHNFQNISIKSLVHDMLEMHRCWVKPQLHDLADKHSLSGH